MQPAVAQDHTGHHHKSEEVEQFNDVSDAFRANLTQVVEAYLNGKDAFLNSDLDASLAEFETFKNKLEEIGEHGLSGDGQCRGNVAEP
ncbi:MAG: hypothetical protein ACNA8K_14960 [Cyclonatronaceae bacterium]